MSTERYDYTLLLWSGNFNKLKWNKLLWICCKGYDYFTCQMGLTDLRKIFDSASKSLKSPSEKHFKAIVLVVLPQHNHTERIIEDNAFGDITFQKFQGIRINKLGSNVFKKTANKLQSVWCWDCNIQNQLPKYDLFMVRNIFCKKILNLNAVQLT